jgi:Zn-dependent peptidase ImmA (M78 family)
VKATYRVSPEVVAWVIKQIKTSDIPSISLDTTLKAWKTGETIPTFDEIEHVSKKTHIPLGYFFLQRPPEEKIKLMKYRTVASLGSGNPSRDLIDTIADMEQIVDWTRDYLVSGGSEANTIVGKLKNETNVETIAKDIRTTLGISEDWFKTIEDHFKYLRTRISEAGVIVMMNGVVRNNTRRPLDINEFRAFTLIDAYAPLIFINATDSPNGRIFSLLHEFTHIYLGVDNLFNDRNGNNKGVSKLETICNAVAAEILVPSRLFGNIWDTMRSQSATLDVTIARVAHVFKSGNVVIARKALDAGKLTQLLYDRIVHDAILGFNAQKQAQKGNGGNYYKTKGSRIDTRFFAFVIDSVAQGKTLYTEAFRLTDTNRTTFSKLVEGLHA